MTLCALVNTANDPKLVEALVNAVKVQYDWLTSHGLSPVNVMAGRRYDRPEVSYFQFESSDQASEKRSGEPRCGNQNVLQSS